MFGFDKLKRQFIPILVNPRNKKTPLAWRDVWNNKFFVMWLASPPSQAETAPQIEEEVNNYIERYNVIKRHFLVT